jgi:hypothetical protein
LAWPIHFPKDPWLPAELLIKRLLGNSLTGRWGPCLGGSRPPLQVPRFNGNISAELQPEWESQNEVPTRGTQHLMVSCSGWQGWEGPQGSGSSTSAEQMGKERPRGTYGSQAPSQHAAVPPAPTPPRPWEPSMGNPRSAYLWVEGAAASLHSLTVVSSEAQLSPWPSGSPRPSGSKLEVNI